VHRHDLGIESARILRRDGATMALVSKRVLGLARDAVLAGVILGNQSGYDATRTGFGAILWPPMGTRLMDSVPPASTTSALPPRTRSTAHAIASRPDAQKRFTVTAEALCGTPARRLAMRATFIPCSPSGIAQPMTTSSTAAGSSPGTRSRAAFNTSAARSSGRTCRKWP